MAEERVKRTVELEICDSRKEGKVGDSSDFVLTAGRA